VKYVDLSHHKGHKPVRKGDWNVLNDTGQHLLDYGDEVNAEIIDEHFVGVVVEDSLLRVHSRRISACVILAVHVVSDSVISSAVPSRLLLQGDTILVLV